jgi:hypothetical protein
VEENRILNPGDFTMIDTLINEDSNYPEAESDKGADRHTSQISIHDLCDSATESESETDSESSESEEDSSQGSDSSDEERNPYHALIMDSEVTADKWIGQISQTCVIGPYSQKNLVIQHMWMNKSAVC